VVLRRAGLEASADPPQPIDFQAPLEQGIDRLADSVEWALDMAAVYAVLGR